MASIRYHKPVNAAGAMQVWQATTRLPVWGRSADVQFGAFVSANMGTCINFGMRPSKDADRVDGAAVKGVLLSRDGGHLVEQFISLPMVTGQIMQFHDLHGAGAELGEALGADLTNRLEMAYELCRRGIRDGFGGPARGIALRTLQQIWERHTLATNNFLRDIAFTIMLQGCGATDAFFLSLFRVLDEKPLRINRIDLPDADSAIEPWSENPFGLSEAVKAYYAEQQRIIKEQQHAVWEAAHPEVADRRAAALGRQKNYQYEQSALNANEETRMSFVGAATPNGKAVELLNMVCGNLAAQEYLRTGKITVRKDGYVFQVAPGHGAITVKDPNGKRAHLCIQSDTVNPIDELVVAATNIEFNFGEWFARANVMNLDGGFAFPEAAIKWRQTYGRRGAA